MNKYVTVTQVIQGILCQSVLLFDSKTDTFPIKKKKSKHRFFGKLSSITNTFFPQCACTVLQS